MKIVILGLITVAFTNVAMAAPSDKGGNDDMILEQMKVLRHQLQQQQHQISEQKLQIRELKEEQLQLKEEQVRRDEDQQFKMEELKEKQERSVQEQERRVEIQERRVEEVTKIQRTRRSENETVEHLKELVLAEIKPMIEDLSECAIGEAHFSHLPTEDLYSKTETIPFGRNFTQTPKVVVSLKGYLSTDEQNQGVHGWNLFLISEAKSITTTQFDLFMYSSIHKVNWIEGTWVACA